MRSSFLARLSTGRPVTTSIVFVSLLVLGTIAIQRIPLQLMPSGFEVPVMFIEAPYRSSPPAEIERELVLPTENALASLDGLLHINSSAGSSQASFVLEFSRNTNMDETWNRVMERLDRVQAQLPKDFRRFYIYKIDPDAIPVLWAGIALPPGSVNDEGTARLVETRVRRMVERVPGVARVQVWGLVDPWVEVSFSRSAIEAAGVNLSEAVQVLAGAQLELASGVVYEGGTRVLVRGLASLPDLEAIRSLPVQDRRIGDLAKVELKRPDRNWMNRVNGMDTISIEVQKESLANTVDVSRDLHTVLEVTLPNDPELTGYSYHIWWDAGATIQDSLQALLGTMLWGGLLAVIVLALFLRRWLLTLLIALAIPLSIGLTVIALFAQGWSINLLTLVGLMLAVGMVVDNAIVVAESIAIHQDDGAGPRDAAVYGAGAVSLAITLATGTSLVVFLPLILLSGDSTATFFLARLGLPICYALLASLWAALYGIPAATVALSRNKTQSSAPSAGRWLPPFRRWYLRLLNRALKRRLLTATLAMLAFLSLLLPRSNVSRSEDTGGSGAFDMTLVLRTEPSMTFEERKEGLLHFEAWLLNRDDLPIDSLRTRIGSWSTVGRIEIKLDKDIPPNRRPEIVQSLKEELPEWPGVRASFGWGDSGLSSKQVVALRLEGDNTTELRQAAKTLAQRLEGVPGVLGVKTGGEDDTLRELQVQMDPERSGILGVAPQAAGQLIRFGLRGADLPPLDWNQQDLPFRARFERDAISNRMELADLQVGVSGRKVALASVSDLHIAKPQQSTERRDRRTAVELEIELNPDLPRDKAWKRIELAMASWHAPEGVRWGPGAWMDQEQLEAARKLQVLGLAVLFVFLLLGALFESVWLPWSVVVSIPFAFVGSYWMLWITGSPLDGMAGLGFVILVGIVVNNAIVLVDLIERRREEGSPRAEAIASSARDRFRPILMTAATTIVGLLPMALGRANVIGISYAPLGRAVIGGLLASTVLSLVLVPVAYTLFDDLREALTRAWHYARAEVPHDP